MAEIYIPSKELIEMLKISSQELIDIEKFFDSIPDDEWELEEGKDYRIVSRSGLREYTFTGAYTIARYVETHRKQSFFDVLKEWFLHTKRNIRRAFVRKKILDNCSSLVKRNNRFFLSKADVIAIFGTNASYLSKMAEAAKRTDTSLIEGEDYESFGDKNELYYSLPGVMKLAKQFSTTLTRKNRREWCDDVGKEAPPYVANTIVNLILDREKAIQKAKDQAKRRDKKICQVTGKKPDKIHNFNLAAHHLYASHAYPHLADVENNLITISCEVHDQFHQHFMGGTHQPCTIDDFIDFVHQYYPTNSKLPAWLAKQKVVLGQQQPIDERKPHVLYLPASRVL
ncbi:hypothetical protein [Leptolyngbya sp. GGD]|uniref:hypothetical protein n=1 Tax=Leptolyngbya sp. GGD TaxID=2997907 RepID=UPI00227C7679|nr:hypothetical protein [Leptolyngbya sp. GGD]MCY6489557.1 hypothetical protein [Leptolyngbya sp. GGD]